MCAGKAGLTLCVSVYICVFVCNCQKKALTDALHEEETRRVLEVRHTNTHPMHKSQAFR